MEQQRLQLEEQERQVAQLRGRIALLEGGVNPSIGGHNGNTVDDFSIKVRLAAFPRPLMSLTPGKLDELYPTYLLASLLITPPNRPYHRTLHLSWTNSSTDGQRTSSARLRCPCKISALPF